jgi:transposase-like protein
LLAELEATSYVAVGRKYGVSDNAIRKWVGAYERERERAAGGAGDAEVIPIDSAQSSNPRMDDAA